MPGPPYERIGDVLDGQELATFKTANQLSSTGRHAEAGTLYDALFTRTKDLVSKAALADLAFVAHFRGGDGAMAAEKACYLSSVDPLLRLALQAPYYDPVVFSRLRCP